IYVLRAAGAEVFCAGNEDTQNIFKKEFPDLRILALKGYNIRYSISRRWFLAKIIRQLPHISSVISYEHNWLKKVVAEYEIDGIISDNRLGLYHAEKPSIYITHQLYIETGNSWLNKLVQPIHYKYINRYANCWVPDTGDSNNLAGKLSHPARFPSTTTVKYLGPLSRFYKEPTPKSIDILVLLSGPEPQRTQFEETILNQLKSFKGEIVFVRGLPSVVKADLLTSSNITCYNHLPAVKLNQVIQESKMVIARAGYTTIMDLALLQQSAILVPTPGQGEQEYLASYLKNKGIFYSCKQEGIDVQQELFNANVFYNKAKTLEFVFDETVVTEWLENLKLIKARQ
ncbi:MAG: glycosyltransferase, partial [Panacibacter sp.]